jgi:lysine biosynthesis protein LysW
MATCPECDAEITVLDDDVEEMEVGDPWDCDACGSRLRVAILDPLEFETDDEEDEDEDEPAAVGAEGNTEELDEDDDDDDDVDEDGEGGDWDE